MTDKQFIEKIIDLIQDKKGSNIAILDLTDVEAASFDYFIVCEGSVNVQVAAIADHIMKEMNDQHSIKPLGYDGFGSLEWVIIDYSSILIHILLPEKRTFYDLESLWGDAKIEAIPNID